MDTKTIEESPQKRFQKLNTLIGHGSYKRVYNSFDQLNGHYVAWSDIPIAGISSKEKKRFLNELSILKKIKHQNLINYLASWYNEEQEKIVLITELVSSGALDKYIKEKPLTIAIIKNWSIQILEGLNYLHNLDPPIIHRDIKCSNIFWDSQQSLIKIGDLGVSVASNSDTKLSIAGTPEFMAPEIFSGSNYDTKADIYAFGMCLLEMYTQEIPFSECLSIPAIYRKVTQGGMPDCLQKINDPQTCQFIMKILSKEPADRPTAADLLKDPFFKINPKTDSKIIYDPSKKEADDMDLTISLKNMTKNDGIFIGSPEESKDTTAVPISSSSTESSANQSNSISSTTQIHTEDNTQMANTSLTPITESRHSSVYSSDDISTVKSDSTFNAPAAPQSINSQSETEDAEGTNRASSNTATSQDLPSSSRYSSINSSDPQMNAFPIIESQSPIEDLSGSQLLSHNTSSKSDLAFSPITNPISIETSFQQNTYTHTNPSISIDSQGPLSTINISEIIDSQNSSTDSDTILKDQILIPYTPYYGDPIKGDNTSYLNTSSTSAISMISPMEEHTMNNDTNSLPVSDSVNERIIPENTQSSPLPLSTTQQSFNISSTNISTVSPSKDVSIVNDMSTDIHKQDSSFNTTNPLPPLSQPASPMSQPDIIHVLPSPVPSLSPTSPQPTNQGVTLNTSHDDESSSVSVSHVSISDSSASPSTSSTQTTVPFIAITSEIHSENQFGDDSVNSSVNPSVNPSMDSSVNPSIPSELILTSSESSKTEPSFIEQTPFVSSTSNIPLNPSLSIVSKETSGVVSDSIETQSLPNKDTDSFNLIKPVDVLPSSSFPSLSVKNPPFTGSSSFLSSPGVSEDAMHPHPPPSPSPIYALPSTHSRVPSTLHNECTSPDLKDTSPESVDSHDSIQSHELLPIHLSLDNNMDTDNHCYNEEPPTEDRINISLKSSIMTPLIPPPPSPLVNIDEMNHSDINTPVLSDNSSSIPSQYNSSIPISNTESSIANNDIKITDIHNQIIESSSTSQQDVCIHENQIEDKMSVNNIDPIGSNPISDIPASTCQIQQQDQHLGIQTILPNVDTINQINQHDSSSPYNLYSDMNPSSSVVSESLFSSTIPPVMTPRTNILADQNDSTITNNITITATTTTTNNNNITNNNNDMNRTLESQPTQDPYMNINNPYNSLNTKEMDQNSSIMMNTLQQNVPIVSLPIPIRGSTLQGSMDPIQSITLPKSIQSPPIQQSYVNITEMKDSETNSSLQSQTQPSIVTIDNGRSQIIDSAQTELSRRGNTMTEGFVPPPPFPALQKSNTYNFSGLPSSMSIRSERSDSDFFENDKLTPINTISASISPDLDSTSPKEDINNSQFPPNLTPPISVPISSTLPGPLPTQLPTHLTTPLLTPNPSTTNTVMTQVDNIDSHTSIPQYPIKSIQSTVNSQYEVVSSPNEVQYSLPPPTAVYSHVNTPTATFSQVPIYPTFNQQVASFPPPATPNEEDHIQQTIPLPTLPGQQDSMTSNTPMNSSSQMNILSTSESVQVNGMMKPIDGLTITNDPYSQDSTSLEKMTIPQEVQPTQSSISTQNMTSINQYPSTVQEVLPTPLQETTIQSSNHSELNKQDIPPQPSGHPTDIQTEEPINTTMNPKSLYPSYTQSNTTNNSVSLPQTISVPPSTYKSIISTTPSQVNKELVPNPVSNVSPNNIMASTTPILSGPPANTDDSRYIYSCIAFYLNIKDILHMDPITYTSREDVVLCHFAISLTNSITLCEECKAVTIQFDIHYIFNEYTYKVYLKIIPQCDSEQKCYNISCSIKKEDSMFSVLISELTKSTKSGYIEEIYVCPVLQIIKQLILLLRNHFSTYISNYNNS